MATTIADPDHATYDVQGQSLADAASDIAARDEAGKTEYWPHLNYTTTSGLVDSADITVTLRITLPRWPGYSAAPAPEQAAWDSFCAALQRHEQGHVDLVHAQYDGMDATLVGQTAAAADQAWKDAAAALQAATAAYDVQTNHGLSQGTVIMLPP
jgi:predicted secreted Zn-dependent protease